MLSLLPTAWIVLILVLAFLLVVATPLTIILVLRRKQQKAWADTQARLAANGMVPHTRMSTPMRGWALWTLILGSVATLALTYFLATTFIGLQVGLLYTILFTAVGFVLLAFWVAMFPFCVLQSIASSLQMQNMLAELLAAQAEKQSHQAMLASSQSQAILSQTSALSRQAEVLNSHSDVLNYQTAVLQQLMSQLTSIGNAQRTYTPPSQQSQRYPASPGRRV